MSPTPPDTLTTASRLAHSVTARRRSRGIAGGIELPTIGVALAIYGGFFLLTFFFRDLPLWVGAPLGTMLLAWHGSFQHETIHGHPTRYRRLNNILATPPLALWIPYQLYRELHLRHHRHGGRYLTHPSRDPESFFYAPGTLAHAGPVRRALYGAHRTLAGRMLLGPALSLQAFWASEFGKVRAGHRRHISIWVRHALKVMLVLTWTVGICRIPLAVYLLLMVYPSVSLSQLRSFAEHRYASDPRQRTVVVEGNPLLGLLFLNNNLHIAHHAYPKLPWYELPDTWRQMRAGMLGTPTVIQGGYTEVLRRFWMKPVIAVEHPEPAEAIARID